MVSALWNACSAGDANAVRDLLNDASDIDIEQKDQFGVTPLIEAVRNGHIEIVKALLDKGADPTNASSQGLPESYTSHPAFVELLRQKAATVSSDDSSKSYEYGTNAPVPYPYYPSAPPEGTAFYAPPPPPSSGSENAHPGGAGNLPPPDVARFIPCRYFPACRYGASCMFLHPQQYYPGSLPPPAPYTAPYDPMNIPQYPPNYFPPPTFPPNGSHPMSPPPHQSLPSSAEVTLPVQQPFSPNGIPAVPYGPLSPNAYPHPGQTPVSMMVSPLPPPHHQIAPHNPMYNNIPSSAPPFLQHDTSIPYPPKPNGVPHENGEVKLQDTPISNHHHSGRDGSGRRGGRRTSFNGTARKPPCLFYPAGRCKNGDDCRYPHVTPETSIPQPGQYLSGSGRGPRTPRQPNNGNVNHITDKMGGLGVRDDAPAQKNGAEGSGRSHQADTNRPRYQQGGKNHHSPNGRSEKRPPPPPKQRVPNADDFPVLAGSITPPTKNTGLNGFSHGQNGLTAAQILSAPAPFRSKDTSSKDSSTRGSSPDPKADIGVAAKVEINALASESLPTATSHNQPAPAKLPISFAAAAAPELPKEIALSA
ncbi:hypothetical protein H0H93_014179 [Arthromyces matolae]|nr:hypothetical protein H0H93_014179 [Arthromyces matolae]